MIDSTAGTDPIQPVAFFYPLGLMTHLSKVGLFAAVAIISSISGCDNSESERDTAMVEVIQSDGNSRTIELDAETLAVSTKPRSSTLSYRTGNCVPDAGRTCVSVYSVPQDDIEVQAIADFDTAIEELAKQGPFTICVDDGVSNQLLIDVMAVVQSESPTGKFSIEPYPCL